MAVQGTASQFDSPALVRVWISRIAPELRLAVVRFGKLLKWKSCVWVLRIECPDLEHIDALGTVDEVQRRIVAKRHAYQALAIKNGPFWMTLEKIIAFPFLDACKPSEVGFGDAFKRAFFTHGNGGVPADAYLAIVRVSVAPRW